MSSTPAFQARPVQLQANSAGAWKTVLQFDASNDAATAQIQQAVSMLHEAAPSTSWQIATMGRPPMVLRYLGKSSYGIWMDRKEPA